MKIIPIITLALFVAGCQSTTSTVLNQNLNEKPVLAVMPLRGEYGEQASDMIAQELAMQGIPTLSRMEMSNILTEQNYRFNEAFDETSFPKYGKLLGVKKIFAGTITTLRGPLYSFPHVNFTLKLIDVETGKIVWIGKYGNAAWTSAISTQGDIQRGAKHIVKEFIKVYGPKI